MLSVEHSKHTVHYLSILLCQSFSESFCPLWHCQHRCSRSALEANCVHDPGFRVSWDGSLWAGTCGGSDELLRFSGEERALLRRDGVWSTGRRLLVCSSSGGETKELRLVSSFTLSTPILQLQEGLPLLEVPHPLEQQFSLRLQLWPLSFQQCRSSGERRPVGDTTAPPALVSGANYGSATFA